MSTSSTRWIPLVLGLGLAAAVGAQTATPAGTLQQRVERLERLLGSDALLQMLQAVEALENEMRQLRGEIELQTHTLNQLMIGRSSCRERV